MMSIRKKTHNLTFIDDSTPEGKFRTALYWERGFELAFEGQRKYDPVSYTHLQLFLPGLIKWYGIKTLVK